MNSSRDSEMPPVRTQRWDTFVSFARENQRVGDLLIHELRSQGLSVPPTQDEPGRHIRPAVAEALSMSGSFVMIVSKASLRSEWAQLETQIARSSLPDSRIFPVVFADTNPDELPSWVSNLPYLHLSDESRSGSVARELHARITNFEPLSWRPPNDQLHFAGLGTMPHRRPLVGAEGYLSRLGAKRLGISIVVGPARSGKTALVAEFVYRERRRFQAVHWVDVCRGSAELPPRNIKAIEKAMRSGDQLVVVDGDGYDALPRWAERVTERHATRNRILITTRELPKSSRLQVIRHDVLNLGESAVHQGMDTEGSITTINPRWDDAREDELDQLDEIIDRLTPAAFVPDIWGRGVLRNEGDEELISLLIDGGWLSAGANGFKLESSLADRILRESSAETVAGIARRLVDILPRPASTEAISLLPHITSFVDRVGADERYFGDAAVRLCVWAGTVWRESGRPQQGVKTAELAIFMSRFRTKPATRLQAFGLAATLATDQGDHRRASQLQQAAIEEAIETLGFDHPLTLATLADLGNTKRHQGLHAESIAALSHVLKSYSESALPSDARRLAIELSLAVSYREAGLVEQALELLSRTSAADPELQLRLDKERAAALLAKGDVAEVLPWLQRQVEVAESVIDRIEALVRVAGAYEKNGDADAAAHNQQRAVELCEVHLGSHHPMTLEARQNLALIVGTAGGSLQAYNILRDVAAKRGEALGTTHRDYLESVLLWASYSARADRIDESLALNELAIDQLGRTIGERAIPTLKAREQLLRLQVDTAKPEALEGLHGLLKDLEEVLPVDHPMTRRVRALLEICAR